MDVKNWLQDLGLDRYSGTFDENGIDAEILPDLTPDDLTEMGITAVGHRRKLLNAIAELAQAAETQDADAPHVERRQLTLLFCDIVSSTENILQQDPETAREVFSAFAHNVEQAAGREQGYVAKFMGDGALVYFGYPKALENNAEAAVRTGLGILELSQDLTWPDGSPVEVRIGVSTGRVVIGDVIGQGTAKEINVVGDTAHLASRLQSKAEPGQLLIDDRSRRMLGDLMVMDPMGYQELKGFGRPITVWNVTGRKDARSRFVALRAGRMTDMIGRENSLGRLSTACIDTAKGTGGIATIRGEPGIGKSRVVHELTNNALGQDMDVMSWFCSPSEVDTPYAPVVAHYGLSLDAPDDAGKSAQLDLLLVPAQSDAEEVKALFERLLGLPESSDILRDYSPPRLRRRTIEVIVEQLLARAALNPMLLVVEDYHWVDPSTAELLDALAETAKSHALFLVLTYRAEIADPWDAAEDVLRVELQRIDDEACREMVLRVAGNSTITEEQVRAIVAKADGVPLFVEELTRSVLDNDQDSGDGEVPDTLQDALMARIDRLNPMRHTIQTAALLGRDFEMGLLTRVLGVEPRRIDSALAAMEDANIVACVDQSGDRAYRFQHALIQDVLASGLLRKDRAELHLKIASLLEQDMKDGTAMHAPERLAGHFEQGGEPMAAMGWYITAGQQAVGRFANREAVNLLDKAVELSRAAPSPDIQASAQLGIAGLKGVALTMLNGWAAPEVGAVYQEAYDLWAVAGGGFDTFPTAIGLLSYSIVRGEFDSALHMAQNALRIAEAAQNTEWKMAAEAEYAALMMYKGRTGEAEAHMERCLALYDPVHHLGHMQFTGKNQAIFMAVHKAMLAASQGKARQADKIVRQAEADAAKLHNAFSDAFAKLSMPATSLFMHDSGEVLQRIDGALEFANTQGFPHMIAQALAMKGWAIVMEHKDPAGLGLLEQGCAMWRGMGARLRLCHYLALHAEAHAVMGNVEEGLALIQETAEVVDTTGEHLHDSDMLRIKADLLAASGQNPKQVEHTYKLAIAVARKLGTHAYEWRAQAHFGRYMIGVGQTEEGYAQLAAANAHFKDAGMTWAVAEFAPLVEDVA